MRKDLVVSLRRETLVGQIFANFANFGQIREIKSSRKILREPIRENKSTRIYFNFSFSELTLSFVSSSTKRLANH